MNKQLEQYGAVIALANLLYDLGIKFRGGFITHENVQAYIARRNLGWILGDYRQMAEDNDS